MAQEKKDSRQIAAILKQYKVGTEINYPVVFNIPVVERLPALIQKDFLQATALVVAALTLAFEKINLKKKGNEGALLVFNIADEIIDTADEDNIALEDVMLFLQGLVRGKYGDASDISVTKFMSKFNDYRDERWEAALNLKLAKEESYKCMGDDNWHERTNRTSSIDQEMLRYRKKIQDQKDEIALRKREKEYKENPYLRDIDNF